jgi:nitroreductase
VTDPHIERVLDAARSAPSHDNRQPVRFSIAGDTVGFAIDAACTGPRDLAMARMALGAAVECACVAAARMGATVRFAAPEDGALVSMSVSDPKRLPDPDLSRTRRVTNRKIYDARALDDATLKALRDATSTRDLAQTHWFGRERVRALAPLIEQAEELRYGDARALESLRFDVKDRDNVEQGIAIASLELTMAERNALTTLRKPSGDGALAAARKTLGARARKQMESASGVCVITTSCSDPMADVDVGRSLQRAWLTLTQKGMAAHPMTAILSLMLEGSAPDADTVDETLEPLLTAFRAAFPHVADGSRVAFLMRVGWTEPPSCRAGRLPIASLVR